MYLHTVPRTNVKQGTVDIDMQLNKDKQTQTYCLVVMYRQVAIGIQTSEKEKPE